METASKEKTVSHSTIDSTASRSLGQYFENFRTSARSPNSAQGPGTGNGSAGVSGFSQIMSQLQTLATSDPTQFKQESANIASQLNAAAGQTSGNEAQLLQSLADQFQQASQTGQLPGLSGHNHVHHHHHGSGSSGSSGTQSAGSSSSDINSLFSQYKPNANGFYGPENATDARLAAIQAGAAGLTMGQTYYVPGVGLCEVV